MKFFLFLICHIALTRGQFSDSSTCKISSPGRAECVTKSIQALFTSPLVNPDRVDLKLDFPSTSFLPVQGNVDITEVSVHGLNGVKIKNVLLNPIYFAKKGEISIDLNLNVPRLSLLGKFQSKTFNGEFQAMLIEYNNDVKFNAKLVNSTNGDFQYFRLTDMKFSQTLKDFKMNFSNATPESHVNLVKMAIEDWIAISKENIVLINTFMQSLFSENVNSVLSNIPHDMILSA
jgi:Haemolymph juvenile hormone binding protein (JHBP)